MFNNKKNNYNLATANFDFIVGEIGTHMIIQRDNLYGIINQLGQEVLKPIYKNITRVNDRTFITESETDFCIFYNFTLLPSIFKSKEAAMQIANAYVA